MPKHTCLVQEVNQPENNPFIYPNPSGGIVHVSNNSQKTESIRLFNLQGDFIREFFTNDFSVADLAAGIYFITVQTDRSSFPRKLVKQ